MPRDAKTVLLCFIATSSLPDTEIHMSAQQYAELRSPHCVSVSPLSPQPATERCALESIVLQVRMNEDLPQEKVLISENAAKSILTEVGTNEVIRVSLLVGAGGNEGSGGGTLLGNDAKKNEMLRDVCDLVEKLTHEKEWYYKQAEEFRSQLEQATDALDLAMEERRVAVSMYSKARAMEQQMIDASMHIRASGGVVAGGAASNAVSGHNERPYPAESPVAEWLNKTGGGYAGKFFHVLEECGYEEMSDLEGMSEEEVAHLIQAAQESGGAKAPQVRRLRAGLEEISAAGTSTHGTTKTVD